MIVGKNFFVFRFSHLCNNIIPHFLQIVKFWEALILAKRKFGKCKLQRRGRTEEVSLGQNLV